MNPQNPFADTKITNVESAVWSLIRNKYKTHTGLVVVVIVAWLILMSVFGFFGGAIIAPIVLVVFFYAFLYQKAYAAFMQQFAESKGYTYADTGDISLLEGSIFINGHSRTMSNVVRGTFNDHQFQLFKYSYTVGSGKNKRTYIFTIFELDFEKTMPHIVLLSKFNNTFHYNMDMNIQGKDLLTLEGNFSKYFDLYTTRDLEIETLEIFTPDVMAELIDHSHKYSIEFVDDKIYICCMGIIGKLADLEMMYNVAKTMSERIGRFLDAKKENWVPGLRER